jgi:hypothetical protein
MRAGYSQTVTEQGFAELGRPADDDHIPLVEALIRQRASVLDAGSQVAARILDAIGAAVQEGGPLAPLLPSTVRFGDMAGLRVMATVHRLALERKAPAVALHLPTLGGSAPSPGQQEAFALAVVAALVDHPEELAVGLAQTPQTNETGRSALLRAALSRLDPFLPVRLNEIGASAGLNLRADHLPGQAALEVGPLPAIIERRGCDLNPVDAATTAGRITLTSYVWVDDVERYELLRQALAVAREVPVELVEQDAGEFVAELALAEGTTTVLWQSAMWLYLPGSTQRRILSALTELGSHATASRQLAHISWEWEPDPDDMTAPFELVMRRWRGGPDDGVAYALVRGHGHGKRLVDAGHHALAAEPLSGATRPG